MTTRRGFLASMIAACAAPAIAKSGVLMPVKTLWTPPALPLIYPIYEKIGPSAAPFDIVNLPPARGDGGIIYVQNSTPFAMLLQPAASEAIAGFGAEVRYALFPGQRLALCGVEPKRWDMIPTWSA